MAYTNVDVEFSLLPVSPIPIDGRSYFTSLADASAAAATAVLAGAACPESGSTTFSNHYIGEIVTVVTTTTTDDTTTHTVTLYVIGADKKLYQIPVSTSPTEVNQTENQEETPEYQGEIE